MDLTQIRYLSPQIQQIAKKHNISRLYIFGSVARGESTEHSDVDFLVEIQENASLFDVAGFSYDIEKLLGLSVDVVPASLLPMVADQCFAKKIKEEAVLL
jgi:predicted nucleotidyltransferase